MGIQGLLPLLAEISNPIHIKEWKGRTVAVDAYVWLHRGAYGCAEQLATGTSTVQYVNYAMKRVRMLLHYGVTPIIVFDGGLLPSKMGTEKDREKRRKDALSKGNALLAEGKKSMARECFVKGVDVTPEMAYQLIKALKREGVQYIVAPYEADPQLAYLERVGIVDGIITEDSDLLVFGCKAVLFKLDSDGNCTEVLRSKFAACREFNFAGWTDYEFCQMAILSGCDYLDSIPGLGLKTAYQLMRKYKRVEKVLQFVRLAGRLKIPETYLEDFRKAELTFRHQRVYDPVAKALTHCTPLPEGLNSDDLLFAGPPMTDAYARGLAIGDIDPITRESMIDINPRAFPPLEDGQPSSTFRPTTTTKKSTTTLTTAKSKAKAAPPVQGSSSLLHYFNVKAATATPVASTSRLQLFLPSKSNSKITTPIVPALAQSKFFASSSHAKSKHQGNAVVVESMVVDDDDDDTIVIDEDAQQEVDEFPDDENIDYDRLDGKVAEAEAFEKDGQRDTEIVVDLDYDAVLEDSFDSVTAIADADERGKEVLEGQSEAEEEAINYDAIFPRPERPYSSTLQHKRSKSDQTLSSLANVSSPVSTQQPAKRSRITVPSLLEGVDEESALTMKMKRSASSDDGGISSPAASQWSSPPAKLFKAEIIKEERKMSGGGVKIEKARVSGARGQGAPHRTVSASSDPIAGSSQSNAEDDVDEIDDDHTPRPAGKRSRSKPAGEDRKMKKRESLPGSSGGKRKKEVPVDEEQNERDAAAGIVAAGWKAKFMSISSRTPQALTARRSLPTPNTASTLRAIPAAMAKPLRPFSSILTPTAVGGKTVSAPSTFRTPLSPKTNDRIQPLDYSVATKPSKDDGAVSEESKGPTVVRNPRLLAFRFNG